MNKLSIIIHKAKIDDIPVIEEILFDVTDYYERTGDPQWRKEDVKWSGLSKIFNIEDFYILTICNENVGCMAVLDYDPVFWPNIQKGTSLFIHKLAVKRSFKGNGYGKLMIDFGKELAVTEGINEVRVDFHKRKTKLHSFYRDEGFVFVREDFLFGNYECCLFEWKASSNQTSKD